LVMDRGKHAEVGEDVTILPWRVTLGGTVGKKIGQNDTRHR